ncbi:MAG: MotA/TolQ/ExbB proton channel family protein [Desulfuromonadales bacterium]|nr:MotA/TolQ/ExbB proton channel family protein [Desulfuromonadales bacterium]
MFELFIKGGPLMYPILLCSILALAIFAERIWLFRRIGRGSEKLLRDVESLAIKKRHDEAVRLCQQIDTPLSRVFLAALRSAGRSREHIKTLVEEVGTRESAILERYLGLLGTIATISPLLGLLGTVLGMIEAFNVIAEVGVGTPATLGGGISQALITTAAGMSVAIPAILLHRYLTSRADRLQLEMEEYSLHITDLLGD